MNHAPLRVERIPLRFCRWFLSYHVDRFDLAVARREEQGRQGPFLDPKSTGHRDLSLGHLSRLLSWLRAENAQGAGIYFRPSRSGTWPLVFLDDIPTAFALRIARKYAVNLVETSPGRTHLWLATQVPLDVGQRAGAQKFLVERLKGLADRGSTSGDHWGRLPGMRNRKPARDCWVNLRGQSHRQAWRPQLATQAPHRRQPTNPHPRAQPQTDPSSDEWGWVMGALENGVSPAVVMQGLLERVKPRRGSDSLRYAQFTVKKACRHLGLRPPS